MYIPHPGYYILLRIYVYNTGATKLTDVLYIGGSKFVPPECTQYILRKVFFQTTCTRLDCKVCTLRQGLGQGLRQDYPFPCGRSGAISRQPRLVIGSWPIKRVRFVILSYYSRAGRSTYICTYSTHFVPPPCSCSCSCSVPVPAPGHISNCMRLAILIYLTFKITKQLPLPTQQLGKLSSIELPFPLFRIE